MKYLVLKGCAGLGNRLITLMKAVHYAELSGRYIYVDWSDGMFGAVGHNVFDDYFNLNYGKTVSLNQVVEAFKTGATTYPSCIEEKDFYIPVYPESSVESSFDVYTPKIANLTLYKIGLSIIPLHKIGYFFGLQSFQRRDKFNDLNWWKTVISANDGKNFPLGSNMWPWLKSDIVFFADFRPLTSMKHFSEIIQLKDSYEKLVNATAYELSLDNAIGVHIRYTDKKPKKQLTRLIKELQYQIRGNNKIFLCTDNKDIEDDFIESFGNKIIATKKYIPKVEGKGIHIWSAQQNNENLKLQMFRESLMDMWLLSKCKYLYWQGNSSFSYISTLLLNDKHKCSDWMNL